MAACSSAGTYPSLSIRDFERSAPNQADPTDAQVNMSPARASDQLLRRISELVDYANSANAAFLAELPDVEQAVAMAQGLSAEDNAWAKAQIALGELDSRRAATAIALGDLDALYTDATLEHVERGELDQARRQIAIILEQQDRVLARLYSN